MELNDLAVEVTRSLPDLPTLGRDLHRRPVVGLQRPETFDCLIAALEGLGLEATRTRSTSSAVVRISVELPGPTAIFRADLDALALQEDASLDFITELPSVMHACRRYLHAAIGVGVGRPLAAHRDRLAGTVLSFFQPGEEVIAGAEPVLGEGALDLAASELVGAYGLHVLTDRPLGVFTTKTGSLMAGAAILDVTVRDRGGHGSATHLARDPNQAIAELITELQTMVTCRFNAFDPEILMVGWIRGGEVGTNNVIPDSASFGAIVRTFTDVNLVAVERYSAEFIAGMCAAYGVQADVTIRSTMTPLSNDPTNAALVQRVATEMFGNERFVPAASPIAGTEDFAAIFHAVPGAFDFIGACPPELDLETAPYNHSNVVVFDNSILADAAAYLAALAFVWLDEVAR